MLVSDSARLAWLQSKDGPLRAELQPLKPSVLKRRLLAAGAPSEDVHATDDADSPKAALIEPVQHERGAAAQAGLETELRAMKRSELRKKAAACGASAAPSSP